MTGNGGAAASGSRPQPAANAAAGFTLAGFTLAGIPVVQQSGEGLSDTVQRLVHVSDLSVEWMRATQRLTGGNLESFFLFFCLFLIWRWVGCTYSNQNEAGLIELACVRRKTHCMTNGLRG